MLRGSAGSPRPDEPAVDLDAGRRPSGSSSPTASAPARPPIEGIERRRQAISSSTGPTCPAAGRDSGGGAIGMSLGFALGRAGSRSPSSSQATTSYRRWTATAGRAVALAADAGHVRTGARVTRITADLTVRPKPVGPRRTTSAERSWIARPAAEHGGPSAQRAGDALSAGRCASKRVGQSTRRGARRRATTTGTRPAHAGAGTRAQPAARTRSGQPAATTSPRPHGRLHDPGARPVGLDREAARRRADPSRLGRAPFADSSAAGVPARPKDWSRLVFDERTVPCSAPTRPAPAPRT